MELVLIRHGRSLGDDENRVEGAGWDAPLTEVGIKQAELLAARLQREGYVLDVLFASPLARAQAVAEIVAQSMGIDVSLDQRLKEIDTGHIGGLTREEAARVNPEPEGGWRAYIPFPGGECVCDLTARIIKFYAELLDKHMDDRVCIVAHGGSVSMLLQVIYGMPFSTPYSHKGRYAFRTADTGMHRLSINGPQDVVTHFLNDHSHLKGHFE